MPIEGEIKSGRLLGYKGSRNMQWTICPKCRQGRWVALSMIKRAEYTGFCHKCNSSVCGGNRIKRGYRQVKSDGYILVKLQPDDFFYSMAERDGYVLEHRLVVARALGRCLHSWEIVHHKGTKYPKGSKEDKADNRYPGNLQLVTDDRHKQITILEAKIQRLKAENVKLKERVKNLEASQ